MIQRNLAGHRSVVIGISAIAVLAIAAAGVLVVVKPGAKALATATLEASLLRLRPIMMTGSRHAIRRSH